jgi:CubicO group peptidase (beta-lactamase class C family)
VRSRYEPITVHHLLTHSSGLVRGTDFGPDPRSIVWGLRQTETGFPPGERCYYSDAGYKVLGLILEAVHGRSYGESLQAGIFDPLGMAATEPALTHALRPRMARGYRLLYDDRPAHPSQPLVPADWVETDSADGSIATTAGDLARYVRLLLNRGRGPAGPLVSEASFERMIRPWSRGDDWVWDSYGYGLHVFEEENFSLVGHGGDTPGYDAYLMADLDNGYGLALLATHPYPPGTVWGCLSTFMAAYLGRPLPELSPSPPPDHVENAAEYAGRYRAGDRVLPVIAEGQRLLLDLAPKPIRLDPRGRDRFYTPHPGWDLYPWQFGRDAGGRVVEVSHGAAWYTNDRYSGPTSFSSPPEWSAFAGHYRAFNPWESNFRVIQRRGQLRLVWPSGNEEVLVPLGEAVFRVGEEAYLPEHLRFDQIVDGQACRANLSGGDYYRTFTP